MHVTEHVSRTSNRPAITRRPRAVLLVAVAAVAAAGCALSASLPTHTVTLRWAAPAAGPGTPHQDEAWIERAYDVATDQTVVTVTTHRGRSFLWMQAPRVTFLYAHRGIGAFERPDTVLLIIRTQDPQIPRSNRLGLDCDGVTTELDGPPLYWREAGTQTDRRHYLFVLPTATMRQLAGCAQGRLTIGDVSVTFGDAQRRRVQAWMATMDHR